MAKGKSSKGTKYVSKGERRLIRCIKALRGGSMVSVTPKMFRG
jgi:hypothetical protein